MSKPKELYLTQDQFRRLVARQRNRVDFKFCPKCGRRNSGNLHFCELCKTELKPEFEPPKAK